MDGTLLDSSYALTCSINFVRKNLGLKPLKKETLEYYINEPDQDLPMIFYGTHEYLAEHKKMFKEHYLKNANLHVKPYDGTYDLLKFLASKKIKLSIATNASDFFAKSMLEHAKILDYFTLIVGSNNVKNSKPNPDMIDLICDKLKRTKNQTILIGDSIKDEQAAKNANIDFLFANWGYGKSNNFKKFDTIFELIDYFEASLS
ncbi:MAG: HAD family hydrolase [Epsilonproteobacteria bacterium]|nr:HAD family hydrolase [Campylobacterota bacterium]